jgi:hypothetical protein
MDRFGWSDFRAGRVVHRWDWERDPAGEGREGAERQAEVLREGRRPDLPMAAFTIYS